MSSPHFKRVALIGLGLIGSSLSHVMRQRGLAEHISGYARSEATRAKAVEIGLVDSMHESAACGGRGCRSRDPLRPGRGLRRGGA